jgi:uncharacterized protein YlxW (UPF0749 family)
VRRIWTLLRPRATLGQLIAGTLSLLLGFAVAVQVHSNTSDPTFANVRQDELIGILSDLSQRSDRLRGDIRELEDTKEDLQRDGLGDTAVEDAKRRSVTYGLLAGTLPARGPGIELTITDPGRHVRAAVLLDTLQELRDAGAEVIQINNVRAGVGTYFLDGRTGIEVDGFPLPGSYVFLAIGDPHTLTTALNIPGGVIKALEASGATGSISQRTDIVVRAVRSS